MAEIREKCAKTSGIKQRTIRGMWRAGQADQEIPPFMLSERVCLREPSGAVVRSGQWTGPRNFHPEEFHIK